MADAVYDAIIIGGGHNGLDSLLPSQEDRTRPCSELSNYRTPIKNYYLCGNSCHVGGGVRVAEDF